MLPGARRKREAPTTVFWTERARAGLYVAHCRCCFLECDAARASLHEAEACLPCARADRSRFLEDEDRLAGRREVGRG